MSANTYGKIAVVAVLALAGLIIGAQFVDSLQNAPNVKFFRAPTISETELPVDFSSIITVTARNNDEQTFSNVDARISVVNGANWEEHLEFPQITRLADGLEPGKTTKTADIPITARKLSGTETPFVVKLEILVDGQKTDEKTFDLTIK